GPNLWTNWWVFVRSAGFSILFGWVWSGQLRALAAAGASRGKWAAWVVVVVVFPLLLVLAIELFVFDRLLHASQRELAMLFLSMVERSCRSSPRSLRAWPSECGSTHRFRRHASSRFANASRVSVPAL